VPVGVDLGLHQNAQPVVLDAQQDAGRRVDDLRRREDAVGVVRAMVRDAVAVGIDLVEFDVAVAKACARLEEAVEVVVRFGRLDLAAPVEVRAAFKCVPLGEQVNFSRSSPSRLWSTPSVVAYQR
jgi:hypothetical protein